jgi:glucokinase
MILAGDIGGTNARLAFFDSENSSLRLVSERIFPSGQYKKFEEIVSQFLEESAVHPDVACFGIAGPIRNDQVETSNLPWVIKKSELAKQMHLPAIFLVNDLEATAWGIGALSPSDLTSLNRVSSAVGNQAVVAPGTGLGEAGLFWDGSRHHVFACEGGHADFAPQGELQIELLQFLAGRYGHVSYERILSGPGLVNVYEFLRGKEKGSTGSEQVLEPVSNFETAAAISQAALNRTNPLAEQALDLWISVYGAEAGNLALKHMAVGGIFLGGGISPKILPKLTGDLFLNAFLDKGRLRPVLENIPVQVITNDKVGLLGAARYGASKLTTVMADAS